MDRDPRRSCEVQCLAASCNFAVASPTIWPRLWRRASPIFVVGVLIAIFAYLVIKGAGSVNWAFLTHTPKPVGEIGGGMANAIVGSAMILGMASLIGIPFGIGAGIYLAEYGRNRLGGLIRFTADVLNGVPSIVIGLVAFSLVVLAARAFLGFRRHRGAGHHDGPDGSEDDGRNAAAGSAARCGKRHSD